LFWDHCFDQGNCLGRMGGRGLPPLPPKEGQGSAWSRKRLEAGARVGIVTPCVSVLIPIGAFLLLRPGRGLSWGQRSRLIAPPQNGCGELGMSSDFQTQNSFPNSLFSFQEQLRVWGIRPLGLGLGWGDRGVGSWIPSRFHSSEGPIQTIA